MMNADMEMAERLKSTTKAKKASVTRKINKITQLMCTFENVVAAEKVLD